MCSSNELLDIAPFIERIYALTSPDFTWGDLRDRCLSFGWPIDEEDDQPGRYAFAWFRLAPRLRLCVDAGPRCAGPTTAFACVCWCDDLDDNAQAATQHSAARVAFNQAFAAYRAQIEAALGAPAAAGQYHYPHRPAQPYVYATWTGPKGVLILRQDERDIQFGLDISVEVRPWNGVEPLPPPPFGE